METKTLRQANVDYGRGAYKAALDGYLRLVDQDATFSKILEFNISSCKRKIEVGSEFNSGDLEIIRDILSSAPVVNKIDDIDFSDYISAINNIKRNIFDLATLISVLKCLKISPFQISLLKSVYDILVKNNIGSIIEEFDLNKSLSLGAIVRIAALENYWLANRYVFKKIATDQGYPEDLIYPIVVSSPAGNLYSSTQVCKKNIQRKSIVSFGTILLNEKKFIGENLVQHYSFCDEWVLVEGACKGYPERKVSDFGCSLDETELIINIFPDPFGKINYIRYGWTFSDGEAAKSELRNEYLKRVCGDYLVVVDADEFYTHDDFNEAINYLKANKNSISAVILPQVHFWKTVESFITGDYYDVSHTRIFKNLFGMKYIRNHNFPEINGQYVHEMGQFKFPRLIKENINGFDYEGPKCYHMGFAKDFEDMQDKTQYYVNRGEDKTRITTTKSRAAWFGGALPDKCKVRKWVGDLPLGIKLAAVKL